MSLQTRLRAYLLAHPKAFRLWAKGAKFISGVHWPRLAAIRNGGLYYRLEEADHDLIRRLLKSYYCFILTRRKSHLTTYTIGLMTWIATKKAAHYTHALMNVEGDLDNNIDFKLIEATSKGVHYSTFMEVFNCDSVAIMKPRGVSLAEWTYVLDEVKADFGREYDMLFDITNNLALSCIELIYDGLKKLPEYRQRFPNFISMIEQQNELTPQMLYDCGDFDVAFEIRR